MAMIIPGNGGNPISLFQAELLQYLGKTFRVLMNFAPVGHLNAGVGIFGNYLGIGMIASCMFNHAADQ